MKATRYYFYPYSLLLVTSLCVSLTACERADQASDATMVSVARYA